MSLFRRRSIRLVLVDARRKQLRTLGYSNFGRTSAKAMRLLIAAELDVSARQIRLTRTAAKD